MMTPSVSDIFQRPSESEASILSYVLRNQGTIQPEIARDCGLSQQTVSRLVNELVDRGALALGQRKASGRRGQPSVSLSVAPEYAYSLGVALMTDAMSVLLMDFAGNVVDYEYIAMPVMTRRAVFERFGEVRARFMEETPAARERLTGVGIGISGYCLDGKSRYNPPRSLDDWAMVPIDELFSDALGLPAWVENDANAAAIGESFLGAGRDHADFVYVFMAAGLGGGVVINHRLMRGKHGNGGELGLILPWRLFQLPTLETLLQSIRKAGVNVDGISQMLSQFDPDWPGVDAWIEQSRDPLSLIASAIAALLDPDVIVLGGRLPRSLAHKIIPAIELFDDARRQEPRPLPKLMVSQTQVDACAIGAAILPLEKTFFTSII
ncbi:MAG: ROK family transcriptional regulator [Erythrobacter sp.]|uniref:ROK family transcriptional regulator n=1 Tax=Erythrobacter sp. TaxID=1042 RepID=UPI002B4997ED|nr:ROK family transcriptional regulator [Erythrobacter sp.]WRH70193.1 MAG: ROK family transcriptional regulator [Erythrobacter sp.]